MGVLYLARDPAIDRLVAIKVLREGLDSREVRERFSREARSAGRLHHPNIVTIFDVGEHQGQPFIAMEYVEGETLADLIQHQKTVSLIQKLQWMEDLCAGLQYAHRSGIVHRDIKPANVMISGDGALKLLDFGIARLDASAMTQGVVGTPNYMAPEQIEGQTADPRVDIFSLGALFYELLSYQRAFPGELAVVLTQILFKAPQPLDGIVAGLDAQLVSIVQRCLEKQPDVRYPDCAALSRDIATVRLRLEFEATNTQTGSAGEDTAPMGDAPRRMHQRLELRRLRAQQVLTHLVRARAAWDRHSYDEACRECEHALVLDPDNAEAAELADRARAALEAELIDGWVAAGRGELGRGALTAASLLVERALSLDSSSPVASALRQAVDEARRQLQEVRDRNRRLDETLAAAEQELGIGSFEQAAALTTAALEIDSTHAASLALQARVAAAIDATHRAEDDARAAAAIDQARQVFAVGRPIEAIEQLARFEPRH